MEKYQVKLIDNEYNREEARELLLALINDKIRFLKRRIFSLQERIGCDTQRLEQRVAELKEEKDRLTSQFEKLKAMDCSIEIDCHVHLNIHELEHAVI